MSERIDNIILIYEENPQVCDDCGKVDELRPYGPNGSKICFNCAMKDPIGTELRMNMQLFGDTEEQARASLIKKGMIKE